MDDLFHLLFHFVLVVSEMTLGVFLGYMLAHLATDRKRR